MTVTEPFEEFETRSIPADLLVRDGVLDVYPGVVKQDLFAIRYSEKGLQLQARGFVGVIPVNDRLTMEVRPRFPVANLNRLVEVSGVPPKLLRDAIRTYGTTGAIYPSLITLYATALERAVTEIRSNGLLREYVWREEVSGSPRGRVLLGRTVAVATARGVPNRAAFGWHERTIDVAANRALLYAVHRLALHNRRAGIEGRAHDYRRVARQLNRCQQQLAGVTLDGSGAFLRDATVADRAPFPPVRAYYRPAVDLALAIVESRAVDIEDQDGKLRLPSLLLDMGTIFEAYLRNVLAEASVVDGWQARVLDGNHGGERGARKANLLDNGPVNFEATPDIVIADGPLHNRTHRCVIEVKYKPSKDGRPERDDLNQDLAYGVSYGAASVVIAQPCSTGHTSGLRWLGSLEGLEVYSYLFDLASGSDMVAEERRFAGALARLL